jgi:hypothetical protein
MTGPVSPADRSATRTSSENVAMMLAPIVALAAAFRHLKAKALN